MKRLVLMVLLVFMMSLLCMSGCNDRGTTVSEISSSEECSEVSNAVTEDSVESSEGVSSVTTNNNPAPKGEWVAYLVKDRATGNYFKTEIRVTDVKTESDDSDYVSSIVDKYNSENNVNAFDKNSLPSVCEFVVADVDIRIPSSEDVEKYKGIPVPLSYRVAKPDGVAYASKDGEGDNIVFETFIGSIDDDNAVVSSGDTVHTQMIYAMFKDFKNYSINISYTQPDGSFSDEYLSVY